MSDSPDVTSPTVEQRAREAIQSRLTEEWGLDSAFYRPSPGQLPGHVHHRVARTAFVALAAAGLEVVDAEQVAEWRKAAERIVTVDIDGRKIRYDQLAECEAALDVVEKEYLRIAERMEKVERIDDLLTPAEKERLAADLRRMGDQRRRIEAEAFGWMP